MRFTWVYLMRNRSEIPTIYQNFTTMIHTQFNAKIKTFCADCTHEYIFTMMRSVLQSHGILFQQSCPYMREQNWVAEWKHCHIFETAHALLISSSVPRSFWAEAVLTYVNFINITPSSVLSEKSSHEHIYSSPPDCNMLCMFGCTCYFLWPNAPSYLPDQLSASYLVSALSIRVIAAVIPYHVFLYPVMSPSFRTPFFLLHLRMFTFCRHIIHYLLSPLEFLLIRSLQNMPCLFLQLITLVQSPLLLYQSRL